MDCTASTPRNVVDWLALATAAYTSFNLRNLMNNSFHGPLFRTYAILTYTLNPNSNPNINPNIADLRNSGPSE